jgi:hypothetical protein
MWPISAEFLRQRTAGRSAQDRSVTNSQIQDVPARLDSGRRRFRRIRETAMQRRAIAQPSRITRGTHRSTAGLIPAALTAFLLLLCFHAQAQPVVPIPAEYGELLKSRTTPAQLGPDLFGDEVNLYDGSGEDGGTGNAETDFGNLTGGVSAPAAEGSGLKPGTQVGENGVIYRPAAGADGPRIDIPASGDKPHETLHYFIGRKSILFTASGEIEAMRSARMACLGARFTAGLHNAACIQRPRRPLDGPEFVGCSLQKQGPLWRALFVMAPAINARLAR